MMSKLKEVTLGNNNQSEKLNSLGHLSNLLSPCSVRYGKLWAQKSNYRSRLVSSHSRNALSKLETNMNSIPSPRARKYKSKHRNRVPKNPQKSTSHISKNLLLNIHPHLLKNKYLKNSHHTRHKRLSLKKTREYSHKQINSNSTKRTNLFHKKIENETLAQQLNQLNTSHNFSKEKIVQLEETIQQQTEKLMALDEVKKENLNLKEKLFAALLKNQDLESDLVSFRLKIQESEHLKTNLSNQFTELKNENNELKQTLKNFSYNLKESLSECKHLKSRLAILDNDFTELTTKFIKSFKIATYTLQSLNNCFNVDRKGQLSSQAFLQQGLDNVLNIKQNLEKLNYTLSNSHSKQNVSKINQFNKEASPLGGDGFFLFSKSNEEPNKSHSELYHKTKGFIQLQPERFITPELKELIKLFRTVLSVILELGEKAGKIVDYRNFETTFD